MALRACRFRRSPHRNAAFGARICGCWCTARRSALPMLPPTIAASVLIPTTATAIPENSRDCDGHTHSHDCDGHTHSHDCDGHTHSHSHSSLADISHLISHLPVSQKVRQDAQAVYGLIAEAESHAHGQPVSEIHFHEVGALDAVLDVLGVCLLMERIGAQKVLASPVHVGSGAGALCPWGFARPRAGDCPYSARRAHLWRAGAGRALYPNRRSAFKVLFSGLLPHARPQRLRHRLRHGHQGF